MRPNEVAVIIEFVDLNLDMESLREEETRKGVIEGMQEQSRATA